jgi:hypothetical protein
MYLCTRTFTQANHCNLLGTEDFYLHLTSYFVGYYTVGKLINFLRFYLGYLFKFYVVVYNVINRNAILTSKSISVKIIEYL